MKRVNEIDTLSLKTRLWTMSRIRTHDKPSANHRNAVQSLHISPPKHNLDYLPLCLLRLWWCFPPTTRPALQSQELLTSLDLSSPGLQWAAPATPSEWNTSQSSWTFKFAILEGLLLMMRPSLMEYTDTLEVQPMPVEKCQEIWCLSLNARRIFGRYLYTHKCRCILLLACVFMSVYYGMKVIMSL